MVVPDVQFGQVITSFESSWPLDFGNLSFGSIPSFSFSSHVNRELKLDWVILLWPSENNCSCMSIPNLMGACRENNLRYGIALRCVALFWTVVLLSSNRAQLSPASVRIVSRGTAHMRSSLVEPRRSIITGPKTCISNQLCWIWLLKRTTF